MDCSGGARFLAFSIVRWVIFNYETHTMDCPFRCFATW